MYDYAEQCYYTSIEADDSKGHVYQKYGNMLLKQRKKGEK